MQIKDLNPRKKQITNQKNDHIWNRVLPIAQNDEENKGAVPQQLYDHCEQVRLNENSRRRPKYKTEENSCRDG